MKTNFTIFRNMLTAMLICLVSGSVWGEELIFDFSAAASEYTPTFPESNSPAVKTGTYLTPNGYSITLNVGTAFYRFNQSNCLLMGKTTGSYLELPSFSDKIIKSITISTPKTVGACNVGIFNGSTVVVDAKSIASGQAADYEYEIPEASQATGIAYRIQLTNAKNVQITKVKLVYEVTSISVKAPTISPEAGIYFASQDVTITQEDGATIYYTTDGTNPKENGTEYKDPFKVSSTTTVIAVAKSGEDYSALASAKYIIKKQTAELPYSIDFKTDLGDWIVSDKLNESATWQSNATKGASINGFKKNSESWLISPAVTSDKNIVLSFESATQYTGPAVQLYYATDYNINDGSATWTDITEMAQWATTESFTSSGNLAITVTSPVRFAFKYTGSTDAASEWNITNLKIEEGAPIDQVETPTFTPAGGADAANAVKVEYGTKVTVACATTDAKVYDATTNAEITEPIAITAASQEIKAIAKKESMQDSETISAWYSAYVAAPTFSEEGSITAGTEVTISSTTEGASILYTIGSGSEQTAASPVKVTINEACTIKAKAKIGDLTSEEVTAEYTIFTPTTTTGVLAVQFTKDEVTTWYAMAQTAMETEEGKGENLNRKEIEVIEGKAKATEDLVWTIESDGSTTYLKTKSGKYVAQKNVGETKIILTDEPYAWNTEKTGDVYIFSTPDNEYSLAYNNSYSAFRCYKVTTLTGSTGNGYSREFYIMDLYNDTPDNIAANEVNGLSAYSVNGALIINTDKAQTVQLYSIEGRMVTTIELTEGENIINGLAKGIYLMKNQKMIIK